MTDEVVVRTIEEVIDATRECNQFAIEGDDEFLAYAEAVVREIDRNPLPRPVTPSQERLLRLNKPPRVIIDYDADSTVVTDPHPNAPKPRSSAAASRTFSRRTGVIGLAAVAIFALLGAEYEFRSHGESAPQSLHWAIVAVVAVCAVLLLAGHAVETGYDVEVHWEVAQRVKGRIVITKVATKVPRQSPRKRRARGAGASPSGSNGTGR
jgi:hypothetical protein